MSPRSLPAFTVLLALLCAAPAAQAQQPWDQGGGYGQGWSDDDGGGGGQGWDDGGGQGWDDDGSGQDQDWWNQQPGGEVPEAPVLPEEPVLPTTTAKTVSGKVAMLRTDGRAAIPRGAPKKVREIIRNANQIVGKKYKWGGGHGARLTDTGYDCSGTVSYPLVRVGLQRSVVVSGALAKMYAGGAGRHVTIYANKGHVYMEVAGLRLDTSAVGDRRGGKGPRWRPVIGARTGFKVRHPVGL